MATNTAMAAFLATLSPEQAAAYQAATAQAVPTAHKRPKAGTLTGQVWDLCDEQAKAGPVVRANVIKAGLAKGLVLATITTQYQAWKGAQAAQAAKAAAAPLTAQDWV